MSLTGLDYDTVHGPTGSARRARRRRGARRAVAPLAAASPEHAGAARRPPTGRSASASALASAWTLTAGAGAGAERPHPVGRALEVKGGRGESKTGRHPRQKAEARRGGARRCAGPGRRGRCWPSGAAAARAPPTRRSVHALFPRPPPCRIARRHPPVTNAPRPPLAARPPLKKIGITMHLSDALRRSFAVQRGVGEHTAFDFLQSD